MYIYTHTYTYIPYVTELGRTPSSREPCSSDRGSRC